MALSTPLHFLRDDRPLQRFLAKLTDGKLVGWGDNAEGCTGLGTDQPTHPVPKVMTLVAEKTYAQSSADSAGSSPSGSIDKLLIPHIKFVYVSAGLFHTLAMTDDGLVYSWGRGEGGRLGHGNHEMVSKPKKIDYFEKNRCISIGAGYHHSLAINAAGSLYAFGNGWSGQLGTGDNSDRSTPTRISRFDVLDSNDTPSFTAVAGGYYHSLALTEQGRIYSWGYGEYGQLGHGEKKRQQFPKVIDGFKGVVFTAVSASEFHTVALASTGKIYAFGQNRQGQLGSVDAAVKERLRPKEVLIEGDPPVKFSSVAAGSTHTLAVSDSGQLWIWGRPPLQRVPIKPTKLEVAEAKLTFAQVSTRLTHCLALTSTGQLYTWGFNEQGQCGNDSESSPPNPTLVVTTHTYNQIAAGGSHSIAIVGSNPQTQRQFRSRDKLSIRNPSLIKAFLATGSTSSTRASSPPGSPLASRGSSAPNMMGAITSLAGTGAAFPDLPGQLDDLLLARLEELVQLEQDVMTKKDSILKKEKQLLREKEDVLLKEKALLREKEAIIKKLMSNG